MLLLLYYYYPLSSVCWAVGRSLVSVGGCRVADTVHALKGSQPGVKDSYLQNPGWRARGQGFGEVAAGRNNGMASIAQLGEGSLGWLGPHLTRSPWSSLTVKWPSSLGLGTPSSGSLVHLWVSPPVTDFLLNPSCPSSSWASQSMVVFLLPGQLVCLGRPGTSCLPRTVPPTPHLRHGPSFSSGPPALQCGCASGGAQTERGSPSRLTRAEAGREQVERPSCDAGPSFNAAL